MQLPARPSLEQLKKRAKALLKELESGTAGAISRAAESHPRWHELAPNTSSQPNVTLADAQLILAREYGFESWPKMRAHVIAQEPAPANEPISHAIREAAGKGDLPLLTTLLDQHPELIDDPGGPGVRTALHQAVFGNHPEAIQLLLERGANPNIRCEGDHAYPLHFAVEKNRVPIIRLLVEHGADTIGEGDYHELGVLGWATAWDYIDADRTTVDYLFAHGAQHNIFSAVAMGAVDAIRAIVAKSPEQLDRRMDMASHRRRPLHLAVIKQQPEALAALLELGADKESLDEAGFTALDQAAMNQESAMVQTLLDHRAKLRLPAAIALHRKHEIDALIARDPNCLKPGGRWGTLIVRAAERRGSNASPEMIETLIRLGADVNAADDPKTAVDTTWGYTPLHAAAFRGNMQIVETLLQHGANVRAREEKWHGTPAGWANYAGHTAVRDRILREPVDIMDAIEYSLIERLETILSGDPESLNRPFEKYAIFPLYAEDWFTPLVFAIAQDKADAVQCLLTHGANITVQSPDGKTLMDLARSKASPEIIQLLETHRTQ